MNRNRFKALGIAVLLTGFVSPAWSEDLNAKQGGDPVREARRLVEQLRVELRPIEEQIAASPYITALENRQVSLDNLKAFAGEQYHILRSDLRSNAHMVSRFGTEPHGSFFLDLTTGESLAIGLFLDFASALGLDEEDLQAYQPRPRGQTYPSYAAWLAFYGTKSDIAAAYLLNFPVFGRNTGRMGAALRNRYGFTAAETAFFDFFATLPPTFETEALKVIQDGLDRGANPDDVRRSARLLQAYEKDFWDAVATN